MALMLHPIEIPTPDRSSLCHDCDAFIAELAELTCTRDAEVEQALESTAVAEAEERFRSSYAERFSAWMEHRRTHESGSLRRYLAILNQ